MTDRPSGQLEELLDAYADGLMDDERRSAFERDLEDRTELRAELRRQREIDAALDRLLAPPPREKIDAVLESAMQRHAQQTAAPSGPVWYRFPAAMRRFAVAAALAMAVLGAWMIWGVLGPRGGSIDPYAPQAYRDMETVYRDEIEAGFEPAWVCATDEEFADTFSRQLGQPLLLGDLPDGVAALGLGYSNTISPRTVLLLAEVEGEPVLVFIDREDADDRRSPPPGEDVHMRRREVGELVLYELSRFEKRSVIDYLFNPDEEAEP